MNKSLFLKYHVTQVSIAECGIACLESVFRTYGFVPEKEALRKLSGITNRGTSLLGLCEASSKLGLLADGYEGSIEELKKISNASILHVVINSNQFHYVVCYGFNGKHFIIGDPGRGIQEFLPADLDDIWKSKRLLTFSGQINSLKFYSINKQDQKRKKVGIWELIEDDIGLLILSVILGLAVSILSLSLAYFSQVLLYDLLKNEQHQKKLIVAFIILLFTFLARNSLVFFRDLIFLKQGKNLSKRMNKYFYKKLLNLPISFYQSMHTGDLIARINDIVRIQNVINYIFSSLVIDFFLFLVLMSFILLTIPLLGFAIIAISILFLLISYFQTKRVIQAQKLVIESYSINEATYLTALQAIDVIKSHNKEDLFSKITSDVHGLFQENLAQFSGFKNRLHLVYSVFGSLIIVITIFFATQMFFQKELLIGSLVALMQVSLLIISPITNISLSNFKIQEAKIAFDRINEFAQVEPEYNIKEDSAKAKIDNLELIRVTELYFKFAGTVKLIENLNLEIIKGDFVALVGVSGAGKSTLLRVMQMFYEIPKDKISVNNIEWNELSIKNWREIVGVVPQEIKIFNTSIVGNISIDETADLVQVEKFCVEIGMDKFFRRMSEGYNTVVGETGINLSGGQKQLLGLARALYKKPQLLFLDEATSFLDNETQDYVFSLLKQLIIERQLTVVYVTHDAKLLKYANKTFEIC